MYSKQLESFVRAAEEGSFSKAARLLYMAPASLIQQINLFEARLGLTLFDRGPRGITLTEAGESLYRDAVEIMRSADTAVRHAKGVQEGDACVRVGTSLLFKCRTLVDCCARMAEEHPNVRIELVSVSNPDEANWQPLRGLGSEYDMLEGLYLSELHRDRCGFLETQTVSLLPAVPVSHSLFQRERLSFEDLEGHSVVLLRRGLSRSFDDLRDRLAAVQGVKIVDAPFYNFNVFAACEINGHILMTPDVWQDIHPQLHVRELEHAYCAPYGIMHAKELSASAEALLSLVERAGRASGQASE